jgi:hypothetical protein
MADRRRARRRRAVRALAAALAGAVLPLVLAACGGFGPTFTATGPCTADGRASGAYPDLEAKVPRAISGRPATTVDSGRNCSTDALGTLADHGVTEIRFAGATWDEGGGNGVSIAILAVPEGELQAAWAEEFYQAGAEAAKHTEHLETSRPTYPGAGTVFRLDTLNDLSFQTVVVWPDGPMVRVVIVATQVSPSASRSVHDVRVAEAIGAATLMDQPSAGPGGTPVPDGTPVLPSPS